MLSRLAEWLRERIAIAEEDQAFWRLFGAKDDPKLKVEMDDRDRRIRRNKKLLEKCENGDH